MRKAIRLEIEYDDGRVEFAEGAAADQIMGWFNGCEAMAIAHGSRYDGLKLHVRPRRKGPEEGRKLLADLFRRVRERAIEDAYLAARGQDSADRFARHGTSQLYWKGRSDAAAAVRGLEKERA